MIRVGMGEDIHRIDEARTLVLGGIIIEEGPGLLGHSDADILLHAITDAVLGAAALGDIGHYFPPSDPPFAHADSADFLRKALSLAADAGWRVGNIDSTIRAERPEARPVHPPHARTDRRDLRNRPGRSQREGENEREAGRRGPRRGDVRERHRAPRKVASTDLIRPLDRRGRSGCATPCQSSPKFSLTAPASIHQSCLGEKVS